MNQPLCCGIFAAAMLTVMSGAAHAALFSLEASLDGAQEAPTPVVTAATGFATMTYDDASNLLSWNIAYQGLSSSTTAAHFHGPAGVGVPAGVRLNIGGLPSPIINSAAISDAFESELLSGLWYINIHSTLHPGGEIRGQVVVVPEAGTLMLVSVAAAGLGLLWSRRRR